MPRQRHLDLRVRGNMTDDERQELYTLMQQWGRNEDIRYQKVREWVEPKMAALQLERDALSEALRTGHEIVSSAYAHVSHGGPTREEAGAWIDKAAALLYPVASGEPARKP